VIVVGSANAAIGMDAARAVLETGGRALDAVEAAVRAVEDDPDDHTVGYGGYPNYDGVVELDASIMDGARRAVGAVGALVGFRHPITVARQVLERLPHVLLVGEGAGRFARSIGMVPEDLLTEPARRAWAEGLDGRTPSRDEGELLAALVRSLSTDPEHVGGTVNVIARDRDGHIASAVSTSGWAWKHPGRLGDSPIIGAGNYADDRYGAAACTGYGELAIRASTAAMVVAAMRAGVDVAEACRTALEDLASLGTPLLSDMNIVAIDARGEPAAVTTGDESAYVVWRAGQTTAELRPRQVVRPG